MEFWTLRDGPTVPLDAVHLALDLEARGFMLQADGAILRVTPKGETPRDSLTEEDRTAIRRWKTHLLVVVSYCADHK